MDLDTRNRASHPPAWPIISVYGAVVMGVMVFSYFNQEESDRDSISSTSVASADVGALSPSGPKAGLSPSNSARAPTAMSAVRLPKSFVPKSTIIRSGRSLSSVHAETRRERWSDL